MAKNILQDIVPPEKKSIRNIPVPNRGRGSSYTPAPVPIPKVQKTSTYNEPVYEAPIIERGSAVPEPANTWENDSPKAYPYEDESNSGTFGNKKVIWASIIVAIFIVAFAVASLFNSATVTVTPNQKTVTAVATTVFTAKKEPAQGELAFQVVKVTKSAGIDVPATGEEKVERKASGTLVIYNNFDANQQRLIKNTRFQNSDGLTYRINESAVVPGKKTVSGTVVPGSVEVTVYADEAGDKYNIGKTDFTIPGFKGDPKFKDIYARSKTDMTGGFVGTVKKVSDADGTKAKNDIHNTLQADLKKEVMSQVPADFSLYNDAIFYTFKSLPQTGSGGSTVTLNEEGTIYGILFNSKVLAGFIASKLAPDLTKSDVSISSDESLRLTIKDKQTLDPENLNTISFTLNGPINFLSQFDSEKLKADLVGQPKANLNTILANYPAIKKANASIHPIWKSSFPTNVKDITIKITPEN
jgi:hypothetical protein